MAIKHKYRHYIRKYKNKFFLVVDFYELRKLWAKSYVRYTTARSDYRFLHDRSDLNFYYTDAVYQHTRPENFTDLFQEFYLKYGYIDKP
jgi:hypothetical protein